MPKVTITAVDPLTQWIRADGMPGAADDPGAKEVRRVSVQLDVTGSGKRPTAGEVQLLVPEPYSQAGVIQAAKDAFARLKNRHPDEGITLEVI